MLPMQSGNAVSMSSREIADLVGSRHDSVKRTIDTLAKKGVIGTPPAVEYPDSLGRPASEYRICKRDSFIIVAQLSPEFTAALVDRWQELESKQSVMVPTTLSAALRLAADQAEQIEQQAKQLAIAAPKVEFVDRYVDGSGLKGFRQVCKLLSAKENAFRDFLDEKRVMYRLGGEWVPYAEHVDAGRFAVKTGQADNGHNFNAAKFTAKGVQWVAGLWAVHRLEAAV